MKNSRESILTKASELLKEWDDKLIDLEKKLLKTKKSSKKEIEKYIEQIKAKKEKLQNKRKEWQEKKSGAFSEIYKELERLSKEVTKSFGLIYDHIKKIF